MDTYELKIIGSDDYEYNIDEIKIIIIKNNLGVSFEFKPDEIKSIELIKIPNEPQNQN